MHIVKYKGCNAGHYCMSKEALRDIRADGQIRGRLYNTFRLLMFCLSFLSTSLYAQPSNFTDSTIQNMSVRLESLNQISLQNNIPYNILSETMQEINQLQSQITLCIQSATSQLNKINHLKNDLKLSDTTLSDKQSYQFILTEETNQSKRKTICEFLNYRLDEIHSVITMKINSVSKIKFLQKKPSLMDIHHISDLNPHLTMQLIYHYLGLDQLHTMQWIHLALLLILGVFLSIIIRRKYSFPVTTITRVCKRYLIYILPLGVVCAYLNWNTNLYYPFVLIINTLTLVAIGLFMLSACLMVGLKKNIWPEGGSILNVAFLITYYSYMLIQMYAHENNLYALEYFDLIWPAYILAVLKLILTFTSSSKQWLTQALISTVQFRALTISVIACICYSIYVVFANRSGSAGLLIVLKTLNITLLNLSYYFIIEPFIPLLVSKNHVSFVSNTLKMFGFMAILSSWFGYDYFAIAFIPHIIISLVILYVAYDANKLLIRVYGNLSHKNHASSIKLRHILGITTDKKLTELYVIRLIGTIALVIVITTTLLELWGLTTYQAAQIMQFIHNGITISNEKLVLGKILKAILLFCIIMLLGRAASTYYLRNKLANEEKHTKIMFQSIINYLFFALGLVIALFSAGVNVRSVVVVAGALSVGIGFGLQSFIRDFISGLIIMINKSIKIGDYIEVGDRNKNEGYIKQIGALSTQLHTTSHSDVIIPNSEIITKVTTNFTFHHNTFSSIKITVKLSRECDFYWGKEQLLKIASKHPSVIQTPPYQPVVFFELYHLDLCCVVNELKKKEEVISDIQLEIAQVFKDYIVAE